MNAITNIGTNTLSGTLKSILPNCDRIDALVGYFYFSGFQDLAKELADKKIRILVGMDIDKRIIEKVSTLKGFDLDVHTSDVHISSRSRVRDEYIEDFSKVFNDTDYFDSSESQDAFKIFLAKLSDGSLEIKKTSTSNHSKFYILHNRPEFSANGIAPGIVIEGSSNLTISGLKGQGEHNRTLQEKHYYDDDVKRFEECWSDPENITIIDLQTVDEFVRQIKKKIWLFALPRPRALYYKVLKEYFEVDSIEDLKAPSEITAGKFFDLKYQKDAISLGIDRIKKFGGVIIADVVGLGKSIVASAIAHNLGLKTIIIAPPHLESQWKDYMADFDFKGFVYSTGKIQDALDRHGSDSGKLLVILDEAHKHRNEDTENYKILHKLCAGNMVMALSATPFNNDPKDIYALIKLFSTPGQSTLKTVENLSMSFHQLFKSYRILRREMRRGGKKNGEDSVAEIKDGAQEIADELRKMIEPLVIRRSRLDLEEIKAYKKDLIAQGVSFAKVKNPELLEYDLGETTQPYVATLDRIASTDESDSFIGARYKPAKYIREGSEFLRKLAESDEDEQEMSPEEQIQRLQQGQANVSKFMRRLLVRRFESSIAAFKISLDNMIASSETMLNWYTSRGEVPVLKKGALPELSELEEMTDTEIEEELNILTGKGLILIPKDALDPNFEVDLKHDIELLKTIRAEWSNHDRDPKYDFFLNKITKSIALDNKRKIIVFSEFSDTADYIFGRLKSAGFTRVFKYSSADANETNKNIIKTNFDAGIELARQADDFDIIIATDAISEGFNLHRAGIVVNYDIPYNPTRVIQRVGRINRINRKVFDELYIWNFFPTPTGEVETHTRAISTLKMDMIHSLLGEDTRIFTSEEDLKNYFAKQYNDENAKNESLSWDAKYRNDWLNVKDDPKILEEINAIPYRARIGRKSAGKAGVVAFAKNGNSYVFAYGDVVENVEIVSPESALPLFEAAETEAALETTTNFEPVYQAAKRHIFKENTRASVDGGRKHAALNKLKFLSEVHPPAKDLCLDAIRAIKDLDALPNGVLKDIGDIKLDKASPDASYAALKEMLPSKYLQDLFATADRAKESGQLMVLSEELIA
ncbi:MAG TPA: helicase-related protein [Candidatus Paceibacterota bacterium]